MKSTLFAAWVLVWVTGCASSRTATGPSAREALSAEEVVRRVRAQARTPHQAFVLEADLSLRSPAFTGSVRAHIVHRRQDSLFVSLTATALRIEAGRLLATRDSFFLYDRVQRRLVYGHWIQASELIPDLFAVTDAFASLLGLITPAADGSWTLDQAGPEVVITSDDADERYLIDPARWRVLMRERRAPDGEILESVRYADYQVADGVSYPGRLIFQQPSAGIVLAATYRSLTMDPQRLEFELDAPLGIPWITVEQLMPPGRQ